MVHAEIILSIQGVAHQAVHPLLDNVFVLVSHLYEVMDTSQS